MTSFQEPQPETRAGILPDHAISDLIDRGHIKASNPITPEQIQPASLDLRLGQVAFRLQAAFLPGSATSVATRLSAVALHKMDISKGAILEKGCVYLIPLLEQLDLPQDVSARANPKSSAGRIDVFVRLLTDYGTAFDNVAAGYHGPLYLEITPQTFSVLVRSGTKLNQLRFKLGDTSLKKTLDIRVDLTGSICGYRAKRHSGILDVDRISAYDPQAFWDPVSIREQSLILDPGEFYILVSKESLGIGPDEAAEMVPIDPSFGEFRVHYAGFFDPGFGLSCGKKDPVTSESRAVLEVRSREVPFLLEDGQIVARLGFESLSSPCHALYGQQGSHYQNQRLKLSKHFRTQEAPDWIEHNQIGCYVR